MTSGHSSAKAGQGRPASWRLSTFPWARRQLSRLKPKALIIDSLQLFKASIDPASLTRSNSVLLRALLFFMEKTPRLSRSTASKHWQSMPITAGRWANLPWQQASAILAHSSEKSERLPFTSVEENPDVNCLSSGLQSWMLTDKQGFTTRSRKFSMFGVVK